MRRKIIYILIFTLTFLQMTASITYAATETKSEDIIIQRYENTLSIKAALTISTSGTANCSGEIVGYGSSNISITVKLMRKDGSVWRQVKLFQKEEIAVPSRFFVSSSGKSAGLAALSQGFGAQKWRKRCRKCISGNLETDSSQ